MGISVVLPTAYHSRISYDSGSCGAWKKTFFDCRFTGFLCLVLNLVRAAADGFDGGEPLACRVGGKSGGKKTALARGDDGYRRQFAFVVSLQIFQHVQGKYREPHRRVGRSASAHTAAGNFILHIHPDRVPDRCGENPSGSLRLH